ncbi:hypothetical protein [Ferrimonas kyonanensis]|uniref:hypothetical protein n=1 Tax=Ferrimonas kyonanensis TaxID=364763 RepID=UPI000480EF25|nr:hypothetical protein [Ferrimonas kyonanensis]
MDKASGVSRVRTWVWLGLALILVLVIWRLSISSQQLQHQQQQLHQRLLINRLIEHRLEQWRDQPQLPWAELERLSRYGYRTEEVDLDEFLVLYLVTLAPLLQPLSVDTPAPPPPPSLTADPALQQALTQVSQQQRQLQQQQRQLQQQQHRQQRQLSSLSERQQQFDARWQQQQEQQHSDEISVVPLYIKTEPAHARIEILNISPRFVQGLALPSGRYLVQVSATGFNTSNRWLDLKPLSNRYCISLSPVDALQGPTPGQHQSAIFESTCVID